MTNPEKIKIRRKTAAYNEETWVRASNARTRVGPIRAILPAPGYFVCRPRMTLARAIMLAASGRRFISINRWVT
jgi:hypothetical protein